MNDVSPKIKSSARLRVPLRRGLRRDRREGEAGITGVARLDGKTKKLTKRLDPGDIAIIDHVDLDRVSAEALASCGVAAVINVARGISGRYPNLGPQILVEAGIPLIDDVGPDVFAKVREGDVVRLDGETLYLDDQVAAKGIRQTPESVEAAMTEARAELPAQLEAFAANTMEYLLAERALLLDGVGVPDVETKISGKHVLIVVRGYDYQADLDVLRPYIREFKPVLVGVDGGADALAESGYTPDIIVGDMDSVSDDVLRCGAEVIVHAYPDGRAPGLTRVHQLGVPAITFPAAATSEDLAMLLADEKGATLIVAVGTHANLGEFLDKGRGGMASTFLTRLKVGGKLVDAKGVSRLYRQNISGSSLLLLVLSAIAAMTSAVAVSTVGKAYLGLLSEWWDNLMFHVQRLF
jgi:uncharacterized membrane-anchored protein